MTIKARYDVYLNTAATDIVLAAECVIEERQGGSFSITWGKVPQNRLESGGCLSTSTTIAGSSAWKDSHRS